MICTMVARGDGMPQDDEEPNVVSYSVKELLAEIKTSIDKLDSKLGSKADREEVQTLAGQLQQEVQELNRQLNHERSRIDNLVNADAVESTATARLIEWRRWAIPVVLSVAMIIISTIQVVKK